MILSSELQQQMRKTEQAQLTVYALGGKPFQAASSLKGSAMDWTPLTSVEARPDRTVRVRLGFNLRPT